MALTTASRLAPYILLKAGERGISVSNLKLQKLLYYCQAWHLAIADGDGDGEALFPERIEAWVHGPVVPPVFGLYKEYRWKDIPPPLVATIEEGPAERPIPDHVAEVLDAYGALSGAELERLTHSEAPWTDARAGIPAHEPSTAIITREAMRRFYTPGE